MSVAAIKAGKDVQCEKPTLTIQEGRFLSDTVSSYGAVFQTSTEDRAIAIYHRMAELVRNGRIGKLRTIRVELPTGHGIQKNYGGLTGPEPPEWFEYDMWLGPAPEAPYHPGRCHWNFRWILDYSGGMLTDWGTHLLDTAQWGNDTERTGPVEIEGHGDFGNDKLYNTAKTYHVEYTYASGVKLIVDSGNPSIRFEGTKGWVGNRGWRGPLQADPPALLDEQIGPEEVHLFTCPGGEHRNFLDCVKSRQDPYFPAEIGHRCSSLCHLGNIAMLTGRKLRWNPGTEKFANDDEANRMRSRAMRSPWHLV
jgi:predicted dehydrogenase